MFLAIAAVVFFVWCEFDRLCQSVEKIPKIGQLAANQNGVYYLSKDGSFQIYNPQTDCWCTKARPSRI